MRIFALKMLPALQQSKLNLKCENNKKTEGAFFDLISLLNKVALFCILMLPVGFKYSLVSHQFNRKAKSTFLSLCLKRKQ